MKTDEPKKKPGEEKEEENKKTGVAGAIGTAGTLQAVPNPDPHSLKVIREILRNDPILVSRTLSDSVPDMVGLRHLLPYLDDAEREILHKAIRGQRLERMWEVALAQKLQAENIDDINAWLHSLAEKLTIRKLQGGSPLEKA